MSAMNNRPHVSKHLVGGTVSTTLRHLYYDVAEICAPAPLKCLLEIAEPSHILFGSDFPFSRHVTPVKDVESAIAAFDTFGGLDSPTRQGIESANALKLFPRLAKRLKIARES
jgi:predicted TIM-barrel fold metal-dependent hydrolase